MIRKLGSAYGIWAWGAILLALLLASPLLVLLFGLSKPAGEGWQHLVDTVLLSYLGQTTKLVLMTGFWSAIFGVSTAWFVSTREFPGRRFLEWALVLPLAIPTYLMAFTQANLFSYTGLVRRLSLLISEKGFYLDLLSPSWLAFILSLCLYPYIYVPVRLAFRGRLAPYLESARALGSGEWRIFRKLMLPLARPALAGGLFLVSMEVLNDFGAVKYFGVNTLTTGIFSAWLSMGDLGTALRLSSLLLLGVLVLLLAEKALRRGKFGEQSTSYPVKRKGEARLLPFLVSWSLFALAFVLPIVQLIHDAFVIGFKDIRSDFLPLLLNSIGLAGATALLIPLFALIMLYSQRLSGGRILNTSIRLATTGYAIPGAVIAVGVLVFTGFLDRQMGQLLLTGSLVAMIFAFSVRFLAVGYNTLEGSFSQRVGHTDQASLGLGKGPLASLRKVVAPLVSRGLLAASALVFVDGLKELPLTLILRPFNFHTFATRAFEYASDEMLARAAAPALCIIIAGSTSIFFIHRMTKNP